MVYGWCDRHITGLTYLLSDAIARPSVHMQQLPAPLFSDPFPNICSLSKRIHNFRIRQLAMFFRTSASRALCSTWRAHCCMWQLAPGHVEKSRNTRERRYFWSRPWSSGMSSGLGSRRAWYHAQKLWKRTGILIAWGIYMAYDKFKTTIYQVFARSRYMTNTYQVHDIVKSTMWTCEAPCETLWAFKLISIQWQML